MQKKLKGNCKLTAVVCAICLKEVIKTDEKIMLSYCETHKNYNVICPRCVKENKRELMPN